MKQDLLIYNTLTRQKELFKPLNAPHVGMYVCGPTVYGDPHLGHARPAITFDVLFRYLTHLGYKVRYVRNITDVGHLEHDADEGDDKIEKKARLEQLEPMEVAQYYTNKDHHYGILSHRNLEDIINNSRELAGVGEKRHQADFALWKKAQPEHIMRWHIDFKYKDGTEANGQPHYREFVSNGFPGWHCECTAMSRKYLGNHFDIHGGGMDLIFPHHECEIAQAVASQGDQMVHYWMHNNMITINGQKMGKSLGNFITLEQFFTGKHETLDQAYSPMTIRFFILSAHYRSTVDFSNDALKAAEKGYQRLMDGISDLMRVTPEKESDAETKAFVEALPQRCYDAMNDDLCTPLVISALFDACHVVNLLTDHKAHISADDLKKLGDTMRLFSCDLLGLSNEHCGSDASREEAFGKVVDLVLELRNEAKQRKEWAVSDKIRNALQSAGFEVKDTKDGVTWKLPV